MSRYSQESDVVFGAVRRGAGEPHVVPVRLKCEPGLSVAELVRSHRTWALRAAALPRAKVAEILDWCGLAPGFVLFESLVAANPGTDGLWPPRPEDALVASCSLVLEVSRADPTWLVLRFDERRFDESTVERMIGHLGTLLASMLEDPGQAPARLPLLTGPERHRILVEWNDTAVDFPAGKCLHELFEERVDATPEAVAVHCGHELLTYAGLDEQANRLARRLRRLGVGPDVPVGVCIDRSLEMVVGMMGISKAGGAYVPMDPTYPADRLEFLLRDSQAAALVTQPHLSASLPEGTSRRVLLDPTAPLDEEPSRMVSGARPDSLAYVIYTSGSTGIPKGAVLNHRGRVNNFCDFNRRYRIGPGDCLLGVSSMSFDMSAYDVFGTLAAGATLVVVENADRLEPARWAQLMARHRVTVWHSVPALLEMVVGYLEHAPHLRPESLRLALLGGDWIPLALPDRLKALVPGVHVVSMGGATEVSMDSTIYDIDTTDPAWKSIPYGRPMANQLAYVLDRELQPLPVGVPGELHLGGIGVGRGYHNRPELTREKFISNPFEQGEGGRLYKTGDLARWLPDGNLELLGRTDFQVKIRGFRVELGEIEAAIREHGDVDECVVLAREGTGGDKRLVGYVRPRRRTRHASPSSSAPASSDERPGRQVSERLLEAQIRTSLGAKLPEYMVPSAFVFLDEFPLTPNGKLNRKGLPTPPVQEERSVDFVPPSGAPERVLAMIWGEVLGLREVGCGDRFIALGGSSLLAAEVLARVQELFGASTPLRDLYDMSLAELASKLEAVGRADGRDVLAIAETYLEVAELSTEEVQRRLGRQAP